MVSEEEFLIEAEKTLAMNERLQMLYSKGKIGKIQYNLSLGVIIRRLVGLRRENLRLIGNSIAGIEYATRAIDARRKLKTMGEKEYLEINHDLMLYKSDLESERDAIELSHGLDYLACVQRSVEAKKYEHYRRVKIDVERIAKAFGNRPANQQKNLRTTMKAMSVIIEPTTNKPPIGALVTGGAFLLSAFMLGGGYADSPIGYLPAALTLAAIAIWTALLHFSSLVAGVEGASWQRAFSCLMTDWVIKAACAIVFAAFIILVLGDESGFGAGMPQNAPIMLFAGIWVLIALAAVPVYCVYLAYDASIGQSVLTVLIEYAIIFTLGVILRLAITMLSG